MADYEVKIVVRDDISIEDRDFINGIINNLCDDLGMEVQKDNVTYSKKTPYRKLEDIPAGFTFYNKLRKYKDYFSTYEYYSYLENDYNGKIIR